MNFIWKEWLWVLINDCNFCLIVKKNNKKKIELIYIFFLLKKYNE